MEPTFSVRGWKRAWVFNQRTVNIFAVEQAAPLGLRLWCCGFPVGVCIGVYSKNVGYSYSERSALRLNPFSAIVYLFLNTSTLYIAQSYTIIQTSKSSTNIVTSQNIDPLPNNPFSAMWSCCDPTRDSDRDCNCDSFNQHLKWEFHQLLKWDSFTSFWNEQL